MLKTTGSFKKLILKTFKASNNKVVKNDCKVDKIVGNLSKCNKLKNNKFKNLIYASNIEAIEKHIFLNLNAKKVFNYL